MLKARDFTHNYLGQDKLGVSPTDSQIKRIQEISLEMYKDILKVCERNSLTIMLGGGSALGAVRHKGFIPWDDDIDLMMARKDFDKFIQLFNNNLGHKYQLKAPHLKGNLSELFIQVMNPNIKKRGIFHDPESPREGIPIDIFCIDYIPHNRILYYIKGSIANALVFIRTSRRMYRGQSKLSKQLFCQSFSSSVYYYSRMALGFLFNCISDSVLCHYFDKVVSTNKENKYVNIPTGRKHYFGEVHRKEVFFPPKEVLFENTKAFIPNNYDIYLKKLYGNNYMQIPPIEKRENHIYTELELNTSL